MRHCRQFVYVVLAPSLRCWTWHRRGHFARRNSLELVVTPPANEKGRHESNPPSGGLLLPGLFLGAIFGGLFGIGAGTVVPSLTGPSRGYALVGMAAFLAGVVHCPITAFLLLFELTGDYQIILPLMISRLVSTLVA